MAAFVMSVLNRQNTAYCRVVLQIPTARAACQFLLHATARGAAARDVAATANQSRGNWGTLSLTRSFACKAVPSASLASVLVPLFKGD
ncbi:hypothetical protein BaRGS_00017488 [Batillaria attramentaria]|uniref:Uncharacterized protein n=1 Tax=Batillaria attramentaria TaxID=370345 RepID=A0ABD0KWU4_9CAEN